VDQLTSQSQRLSREGSKNVRTR